jgi:hypothetical protein
MIFQHLHQLTLRIGAMSIKLDPGTDGSHAANPLDGKADTCRVVHRRAVLNVLPEQLSELVVLICHLIYAEATCLMPICRA